MDAVRPRNIDGKILCPIGYTLKPDGLCYPNDTLNPDERDLATDDIARQQHVPDVPVAPSESAPEHVEQPRPSSVLDVPPVRVRPGRIRPGVVLDMPEDKDDDSDV